MSLQLPNIGKVPSEILDEVILPRLGRSRPEVLVGPGNGVDAGIVDLGHGQVLASTTDPLYILPQFGWERAAWFAVHIIASDLATSGLSPQYMTIDLNLPQNLMKSDLEAIWGTIHTECKKLGIAIITGHTGQYDGCHFPTVGGATMLAIGSAQQYVTPAMAHFGDHVIVTKGAAIETAGSLAVVCSQVVADAYGAEFANTAQGIFEQMSVVHDAQTAVSVGVREQGVSSMHDATERGVWGGLVEVAQAAGLGIVVEKEAIIVPPAVAKICSLFDIDPYSASSEGSLIITCRPHATAEIIRCLADHGIAATQVGELTTPDQGYQYLEGGRRHVMTMPTSDPFWPVLSRHLEAAS